jgi:hypothetical protein
MTAPGTSFPLPPLPDSGMEAIAGGANDGDDFAGSARNGSGSGSGSGKRSGQCVGGTSCSGGPCLGGTSCSGTGGGPLNGGWPAVPKCCS